MPEKFRIDILRNMKSVCGIYAIIGPSGRRYVGQALDTSKRLRGHFRSLEKSEHHCTHLQRAWKKHGRDAFKFEVLMVVDPAMLTKMEQHHMDHYRGRGGIYNVAPAAGSQLGFKHSVETKAEYSKQRKGNKHALGLRHSPEFIERFRAAVSGPKPEGFADKLRAFKTDWWTNPARNVMRANIAARNRTIIWTDDMRRKVSEARKRRPPTVWTAEMKAKVSAAQKRRWVQWRKEHQNDL